MLQGLEEGVEEAEAVERFFAERPPLQLAEQRTPSCDFPGVAGHSDAEACFQSMWAHC